MHKARHAAFVSLGPLVNQALAIEVEPESISAFAAESEAIVAGACGNEIASPADGKFTRAHKTRRRINSIPDEIDTWIYASENRRTLQR